MLLDPWSSGQQCQLASICEYAIDIRLIAGKRFCVADGFLHLSVYSVLAANIDLNYIAMATDQQDAAIQDYLQPLQTFVLKIFLHEVYQPCFCLMSLQVILDKSYSSLAKKSIRSDS